MSDQKWMRLGAITVCIAGGVAAIYLIGRFLIGVFLPFLVALAVAGIARACARKLAPRMRIGERALSVVLVLLILGGVGSAVYLFCGRVLVELQQLVQQLLADSQNAEGMLARALGALRRLGERFSIEGGFLEAFVGEPEAFFAQQLRSFLSGLAERLPAGVAALLGALPRVLLFLTVTVLACFYFALDYPRVTTAVGRLLPAQLRERLPRWRQAAAEAAGRYLRAYFLLFLLTAAELWLGFALLRVKYGFLLSLAVALLDLLPVLGVGTVLVPWGLLSLLMGDVRLGAGLFLLYGVISVVRQVAEPHLVGKSIGLSPVMMLVAFYAGLRLFGVPGLFIGPGLMLLFKSLWHGSAQHAS